MSPLFELEDLDIKRRDIRDRLKEIPSRQEHLASEIARLERSYRDKEQAAASKEKILASLELDLKTSQTQEAEKRVKLNTVKTQKEYDAIKAEIDGTVLERGRLEERILLLMDEITEIKDLLKRGKVTTEMEKKKFSQELEELAATEKKLMDESKILNEQSEAKLRALPDDIRREYNRLRAALPEGQILSKLILTENEFACSTCNSPVAHQIVIDIKRGHALHRCNICHRLLFP